MQPAYATCYSSCCPSQKTTYDEDAEVMRCADGGGACTASNGEAWPVGWRGNYTAPNACRNCFATAVLGCGNTDVQLQRTCGEGAGQVNSSCLSSCCPSRSVYYLDNGAGIACAFGSCKSVNGGSCTPTASPTQLPTAPTAAPSVRPSTTPTAAPSIRPTATPSAAPTPAPTNCPWTINEKSCKDCQSTIDPVTGVSALNCICYDNPALSFSSCCPSGNVEVRFQDGGLYCVEKPPSEADNCAVHDFPIPGNCPSAAWGAAPAGCSSCCETVRFGIPLVTCNCGGASPTSCYASCCPSRQLTNTNGTLTFSDGEGVCFPDDGNPC